MHAGGVEVTDMEKTMMKRIISFMLLFCMLFSAGVCAEAEEPAMTGKVSVIEKTGHARLDITVEEFQAAGFALGDIVHVKAGSFEGDMPFFNGFYVDRGECVLWAYPGHEHITVCLNYGNFAETAGVEVGDEVTITLKEKAGALETQQIRGLTYINNREDYDSDAIFANFREVRTSGIGEGKLYRSASPVNNKFGRAAVTNRLMEEAGIRAVMNMADTDDNILAYAGQEGFASDYYMELYNSGHVIALNMKVDFASDEFAGQMVKGLRFLAGQEPPYLVHCTEGKDRTGFGVMLLEALMGASEEEIVTDYLTSHMNYYHLDPDRDAELLEKIADRNVRDMLRMMAGLEKGADMTGVDLAAAAENYLTTHGMGADALRMLKEKLG